MTPFKNSYYRLLFFVIFLLLVLLSQIFYPYSSKAETAVVTVPSEPTAESVDFASSVLGNPWDMDDFDDISIYLNESGQRLAVDEINFREGTYFGHAPGNDPQNGWFHVLFPGYQDTIHAGKIGSKYPINPNTYQCLYLAMRVETTRSADRFRIMWFANDRLVGGPFGQTNWLNPYPEASSNLSSAWKWKLYKVNLSQQSINQAPYVPWSSQPTWQGLRIDPTFYGDLDYAVDWIRLTNCQSNNISISFTPSQNIHSVWVRPEGSSRYIWIANDVNGGSGRYSLDIQGLQPGNYSVAFGDSASCCITESNQSITIKSRPRLNFESPSFWSGEDYATIQGNPWDFSDGSDVKSMRGTTNTHYQEGELVFTTLPGPLPGGQDAQIILNNPADLDPGQFRYLNFRLNTTWKAPWQNVPDGMIVRWVWSITNASGNRCILVSQDIPFDTGWETLTVDLHDSFAGSAEETAGSCSGLPLHWLSSRPVLEFRFDPNENVTGVADPITGGGPFYQRLDWIRLTKPDIAEQGSIYPIKFALDTPLSEITSFSLYYTTDPDNPTANLIDQQIVNQTPENVHMSNLNLPHLPEDDLAIFLPAVFSRPVLIDSQKVHYYWDTTNIPGGTYHICAELSNTTSQTITCSEATIRIQP